MGRIVRETQARLRGPGVHRRGEPRRRGRPIERRIVAQPRCRGSARRTAARPGDARRPAGSAPALRSARPGDRARMLPGGARCTAPSMRSGASRRVMRRAAGRPGRRRGRARLVWDRARPAGTVVDARATAYDPRGASRTIRGSAPAIARFTIPADPAGRLLEVLRRGGPVGGLRLRSDEGTWSTRAQERRRASTGPATN